MREKKKETKMGTYMCMNKRERRQKRGGPVTGYSFRMYIIRTFYTELR